MNRPGPPAVVLAVGISATLAVAAFAGVGGRDTAVLVGIAGGTALVVALIAHCLVGALRHRGLVTQILVVALGSVVATAAGVAAAAQAMFLSAHDLGVLAVVLVLSASVATTAGWSLGRRIAAGLTTIGEQVGALDGEAVAIPDAELPGADLRRLSAALALAHRQLADARTATERLERSRRELVAWVSHDLRSPIGAVRAMAEALEDGVVTDAADVEAYHQAIVQETARLGRLVDDLFELARIEAGAPTSDVPFVPTHELVAEVVEAAAARAAAQGVRLRADVDRVGPELVVAADVRRAIDNVLDNAIRHTASGGTVTATAQSDGRGLRLVIGDECGGIPTEDLHRIFDVAFRGDQARSRDTGGGGLGLAIARGLLEARAGHISVRNHHRGCEFTVHVPAAVLP